MNINFNIEEVCEKCYYDPLSHSFHLLSENEAECYFYTCPANAKCYDDAEGIIKHMKIELKKKNKPWIWIFDCVGYGLKHLASPSVGKNIAEFLNSDESILLQNIIVVNESITSRIMFNTFWYLLEKRIRDIIVFDTTKEFVKILDYEEKLSMLEMSLIY